MYRGSPLRDDSEKKLLLKKMVYISKLKQTKSYKLENAVKELRVQYGSLRSIARRLGLTWGEMQALYQKRPRIKQKVYIRKFDDETKQSIKEFYLDGPATFSLPESAYASKVFLNRPVREVCDLFNSTRGAK